MSHSTKENILDAIRRTAKESGGVPLGRRKFQKETGIRPYEWGKFWARFGDAQREAGFKPNTRPKAYDEEFLFDKWIALMRELGHYPTSGELSVKCNTDRGFPNKNTMQQFGNKKNTALEISKYATQKGYSDVVEICREIIGSSKTETDDDNLNIGQSKGWVYLFESGQYYKIGKTNNVERRKAELQNGLL
ncbi:MAG: GIY-YIG nuclease family protein [Ignavibacteriales bacterium]|nr:GIY-YIG nuclease family protein [Ignavibacteriales bacterium]